MVAARAAAAVSVVLAAALTGCGSERAAGGVPSGGGVEPAPDPAMSSRADSGPVDPDPVNPDPTNPDVTPPKSGASRSPALDACGLLSPRDRSMAGLTSAGEPVTVGGARACDYTEPGALGVTVTLDERAGLAELGPRLAGADPVRVGAHAALRVADHGADDGTCSVLLEAGDTTPVRSVHVDVVMADFHDTEKACAHATTVAELIEPELR